MVEDVVGHMMDATDRIIEAVDRLITIPGDQRANLPFAERLVFYVVAARCQIDIGGFTSLWDSFSADELDFLVNGLRRVGENVVVNALNTATKQLNEARSVTERGKLKDSLEGIGQQVSSRLWELDEKLTALIDAELA